MHKEMDREFTNAVESPSKTRIVIAAPRENAKSTKAARALPLWCICYKKKKFIVIASDSTPQAKQHVAAIRDELEDNKRLAEAFPDVVGEGRKWTDGEIRTRSGCTVIAAGTGKRIRGLLQRADRPDLLIADDLENDENVSTLEQRDKTQNWFFKAFAKAGKDADIIVTGTILHYDSLLARLLNNPGFRGRKYRSIIRWSQATKLWDKWESILTNWELTNDEREQQADKYYRNNKTAMLEGTQVLWAEFEPYLDLMTQRVTEGPASFDSEKQNEPINPEDCLFQDEWFTWFDEDDINVKGMPIAAACDPSLGKEGKSGCPSAIIALARGPNGVLYIVDADIEKRPPDKIIEDCIELHQRRNLFILGIEAVQFQEFFKDQLIKEASYQGQYPPIHPIKQSKDKLLRIQTLQPLVKSGRLRFQKKHKRLYDQMRYHPKADFMDGPDALEMAVRMVERISMTYHSAGKRNGRRDNTNLKRVFG